MYKLRSRLRNAAAALALLSLAACAGKGCSCVQPIKGGFPVAKRRDNAIQLRATQSLFQYVSANGAKLIPGLIGGNTFNVPPTCARQQDLLRDGEHGVHAQLRLPDACADADGAERAAPRHQRQGQDDDAAADRRADHRHVQHRHRHERRRR